MRGGVQRIYVLVDHRAAELQCVNYGEMLRGALSEALAQQQVENEASIGQLDLLGDAIRAYRPDLVLLVKGTGGVPAYYWVKRGPCGGRLAGYSSLSYEVSILGPALDKPIWRAAASNSGGTGLIRGRLRKMASAIVRRLKKDAVI